MKKKIHTLTWLAFIAPLMLIAGSLQAHSCPGDDCDDCKKEVTHSTAE